MKPAAVWLDPIPTGLREDAVAALEAGDVLGFLITASSNIDWLRLVSMNTSALLARGLYEYALLLALSGARTNNAGCPPALLRALVSLADRAKLLTAGDPLPGDGPFKVYRGVAGRGRGYPRRVRGLSWTLSLPLAAWFAWRSHLAEPAVYRLTAPESSVLAYLNEGHRNEEELLVLCGRTDRPRLCLDGAALVAMAVEHEAAMHRKQMVWLKCTAPGFLDTRGGYQGSAPLVDRRS